MCPAAAGAFVYDHVPGETGVYRLVAAPRMPVTLDALPTHLQAYLGTLRLPVAFGAARLFIGPDGHAQALTD